MLAKDVKAKHGISEKLAGGTQTYPPAIFVCIVLLARRSSIGICLMPMMIQKNILLKGLFCDVCGKSFDIEGEQDMVLSVKLQFRKPPVLKLCFPPQKIVLY